MSYAASSLTCCVRLRQYRTGAIEEGSARWCQFDAASATRQELHAYLLLKITNLPAERRLRGVQFCLCRQGKARGLGHRNEITKVS